MAEKKVNEDLDNLLDSALDDFDANAAKSQEKEVAAKPELPAGLDGNFNFDELKETMKSLLEQDPALMAQLKDASGNSGADFDFSKVMEESMAMFAESFGKINASLNPDGGAGGNEGEDFEAMIRGSLPNLLSRDLIYPGIKDLVTKFPKWLEDNKETVSGEDFARFEGQNEIAKKIVDTFDEEKDEDTEEIRGERINKILELLTDLQKLGNPPPDLVTPVDIPEMPMMPEGCNPQ